MSELSVLREMYGPGKSRHAAIESLVATIDKLRTALDACEVSMDTAALHGLPQQLPEVYRDSWARNHQQARAVLAETRK